MKEAVLFFSVLALICGNLFTDIEKNDQNAVTDPPSCEIETRGLIEDCDYGCY